MKAVLSLVKKELYHYVNGKRVEGVPTDLRGNVTDLSGDVSDLSGNVTGLRGDVDEAEITDKERQKGVNVKDLIK